MMVEEHLETLKTLAKAARRENVEIRLDLDERAKAGQTISMPLADILLSVASKGVKPIQVTVLGTKKSTA